MAYIRVLRIVMLGTAGVGKSSSANTIFGEKVFEEASGFMAGTDTCKKHSGKVFGREITVVDTPGLCDASKSEDELKREVLKCVELSLPGPHVFLLVIRLDVRFSPELENAVKWIQANFGLGATCFTMVLFTHADQLKGKSVEDAFRRVPEIQEIINTFGGRYHVFDNELEDKQTQLRDLLDKIGALVEENGGRHYTDIMCQEAQRKIREEQERKRQEEREREENERRREAREREWREEAVRNVERERVLREEAVQNAERERVLREEAVRNAERERVLREEAVRNAERERVLREQTVQNAERERREADRQRQRESKDMLKGAVSGGVGGGVGGVLGGGLGGGMMGAGVGFILGGPPGATLGATVGARAGATAGGITGAAVGVVEGYRHGGEHGGAAGGRAGGISGTVSGAVAGYKGVTNPTAPDTNGENATNANPAPEGENVPSPNPVPPVPDGGNVPSPNPVPPVPDGGNVPSPNPVPSGTDGEISLPATVGTAGIGITVTLGSNSATPSNSGNGANSATPNNNGNGANSATPNNNGNGAVDASAILSTVVRTVTIGGELGEVVGRLTAQGCEKLIREIENIVTEQ